MHSYDRPKDPRYEGGEKVAESTPYYYKLDVKTGKMLPGTVQLLEPPSFNGPSRELPYWEFGYMPTMTNWVKLKKKLKLNWKELWTLKRAPEDWVESFNKY